MSTMTDARTFLAQAISDAGLECLPYPPDSTTPPIAFVDTLSVDYDPGSGWSFCESGMATATITSCGQRNDKAGAMQSLESMIAPALAKLHAIPGVRVSAVQSGTADVGGAELPAVLYTVTFALLG